MRVLDIGCGWGGWRNLWQAICVSVVGVTISAEQQKWRSSAVRVLMSYSLQDYRDLNDSSTASSPSACSNTSGRKLRHLF
jgi:cyclopropane-fatty-acyl-phospholipid synthase